MRLPKPSGPEGNSSNRSPTREGCLHTMSHQVLADDRSNLLQGCLGCDLSHGFPAPFHSAWDAAPARQRGPLHPLHPLPGPDSRNAIHWRLERTIQVAGLQGLALAV